LISAAPGLPGLLALNESSSSRSYPFFALRFESSARLLWTNENLESVEQLTVCAVVVPRTIQLFVFFRDRSSSMPSTWLAETITATKDISILLLAMASVAATHDCFDKYYLKGANRF
jgi:hypothetical protein